MANISDAFHGMLSPETLEALQDVVDFLDQSDVQDLIDVGDELAALAADATPLAVAADLIAIQQGAITTVTSGAVPVNTLATFISVDATKAYTLADGTVNGQLKVVRCTAAANVPDGTLTPATVTGFSTIGLDAVGECVILQYFTSGGWRVIASSGATIS